MPHIGRPLAWNARSLPAPPRTITAQRAGTCSTCHGEVLPGDTIRWYPSSKRIACNACIHNRIHQKERA